MSMRRIVIAPLLFGLAAVFAGAGCGSNPIILVAYLLNNADPKSPAEYPLKPRPKHEKDEVKVVVLTSCDPSCMSEADLIGIDRMVGSEFISLLESRCKDNQELVTVLKTQALDDFKRKHADWKAMHPIEIGKQLKADYVIEIEVVNVSLYEPRSHQELLKGQATISVKAYDLAKQNQEPAFSPAEFNVDYPPGRPVSRDDQMQVSTFRQKFTKFIAKQLVIPFAPYTAEQKVPTD
jgi:hypothetical protein